MGISTRGYQGTEEWPMKIERNGVLWNKTMAVSGSHDHLDGPSSPSFAWPQASN
jgi:hypothetical protein